MENYKEHIDELIIKFLAKEISQEEKMELSHWISSSDSNLTYFRQLQEVWISTISLKDDGKYNTDVAFQSFKKRISLNTSSKGQNNIKLVRYFQYAAAVILLFFISYLSYRGGESNIKNDFADIIIEVPLGSRTKINLPDGTDVWLNAGSKIVYSQGFGVSDRQVHLSGEGYFKVQRNEKIPFIVKTKDIKLKVLGTKFNFRDNLDDQEAIVSLEEGKVKLSNLIAQDKSIYLLPNQRMVLDKKSGKMKIETVEVSNAREWTEGYLFFDEELLSDIAQELSRSYNVEITIKNETLKNTRFYGNFIRREQSLKEILDILSATNKIHYIIEDKHITLY